MIDKLMESGAVEIRAVGADDVGPLRRTVLHPSKPVSDLVMDPDRDHQARHFGAFRGPDLIGACSVTAEASVLDGRTYPWRLRGVGVLEADRGLGIGKLLILAAIDYVERSSEPELWCNGRADALTFYRNLGFRSAGEPWLGPDSVERVKLYRQ